RAAVKGPLVCYCVVWLTALAVATPYFFAVSAEDLTGLSPWNHADLSDALRRCRGQMPQLCLENAWHRMPFSRRTYTLSVLALQYILPLCALGAAYLRIGSTMLERARTSSTMDRKRKRRTSRRN
ncbi:neuropeptide F receptor, partial [Aphelenchoides avenae]